MLIPTGRGWSLWRLQLQHSSDNHQPVPESDPEGDQSTLCYLYWYSTGVVYLRSLWPAEHSIYLFIYVFAFKDDSKWLMFTSSVVIKIINILLTNTRILEET